MQECSGGNGSEKVNIGVNLNSPVLSRLSLMPVRGRSLLGTLKAGHCFAVVATSSFISGCLEEKGISGREENI